MDLNIKARDYSTFDLSHLHRTTFDMGKLIPLSTKVTMPGDRINVSVDAFVRGMPTIAPILDKIDIKINHFYVPYRVLWNKFEEYYTKNNIHKALGEPAPTLPTTKPKLDSLSGLPFNINYPCGRLADYLGVSPGYGKLNLEYQSISAMPFLAYQKIFLDYYAPQRWVNYLMENGQEHPLAQLKLSLEKVKKGNGGDIGYVSDFTWLGFLQNVNWNHDYFTNALPTPSLFDDAKLNLISQKWEGSSFLIDQGQGNSLSLKFGLTPHGNINNNLLSTVRDLRKNIATQHYLEVLNQGGGRYMETLKVLWNQDMDNRTLQRSEYIGGDVLQLFVNEVESTATTDKGNLGDVGGKPVGGGTTENEYFEADEFGIYMCLMHVVPKRTYSDAMSKSLWFTKDVDDLPNPEFEGIGDEAVYQYELTGKHTGVNYGLGVWGYVPRYSEYKTSIDRFSGEMRHTLEHWHLGSNAEEVEQYTTISPEFLNCNPREDIFNVDEPDKFLGTFNVKIKAQRKLSANPTPGIPYI